MPSENNIIVIDPFPITKDDTPVQLHIHITGGINEASTAWVCGDKHGNRKNSFDNEAIGAATEVISHDLVVVTRLLDLDEKADSFTYRFKLSAGSRTYEYSKTKKFDGGPPKGRSVKFTTILTL